MCAPIHKAGGAASEFAAIEGQQAVFTCEPPFRVKKKHLQQETQDKRQGQGCQGIP
jgi:hypothetical protein